MNKKKILIAACFIATASYAQDTTRYPSTMPPENKTMKHEETEIYSPVPPIITPGNACGDAPSDAVILFNGENLDQWRSANDTTKPALWTVANGIMTVNKTAGNIETKQRFLDYQLHIEWKIPEKYFGK